MTTPAPTARRVEQLMGMPISLALRGRYAESDRAEAAWQRTLAELGEVDRIFSTWKADSVISRLDRGELDLADCPAEVAEVLELGERARVESGGAFDVRRAGADGRVALDPSGVVKGWAVQRAARFFDDLDETDVCLSAGGDLVCRTRMPGSEGWRIGIEDPHDPQRVLAVVPVRTGAVATSGAAHRGAHIQDPRDGSTPTALASVTVVAADLTWADIDATAAYVLGATAAAWLQERPGRSGLIVTAAGEVSTFASGR